MGGSIGVVVKETIPSKSGVLVVGNYSASGHEASRIVDADYNAPTIKENHGTINAIMEKDITKSELVGGFGKKGTTDQYHLQNRVYSSSSSSPAIPASFQPYYTSGLRIRKLTPKECFRLMGVRDEDFERVAANQTNASLYHPAGDSIVVNVLMAIFRELL